MAASGFSDETYSVADEAHGGSGGGLPRTWPFNVLLFVLTLLTSTGFGAAVVTSFRQGRPLELNAVVDGYVALLHLERTMWSGLWFSVPLLIILLAHELGHFLQCRRRRVEASWPYFLPSPSLFGTFGAFIRIRSPIYTRAGLFDIGIGGPLAGFAVLTPVFAVGMWFSRVVTLPAAGAPILFGTPLLLRLAEALRFPGAPAGHILLHPMALAAWAGLFATALNLLPIGQLDGGHIVYALAGEQWHRRVSLLFIALLALGGFLYWPWWLWGGAMFFFGRRHPLIYDRMPLSRGRVWLCTLALALFLLSVTIVPVRAV